MTTILFYFLISTHQRGHGFRIQKYDSFSLDEMDNMLSLLFKSLHIMQFSHAHSIQLYLDPVVTAQTNPGRKTDQG